MVTKLIADSYNASQQESKTHRAWVVPTVPGRRRAERRANPSGRASARQLTTPWFASGPGRTSSGWCASSATGIRHSSRAPRRWLRQPAPGHSDRPRTDLRRNVRNVIRRESRRSLAASASESEATCTTGASGAKLTALASTALIADPFVEVVVMARIRREVKTDG